MTATAEVHSITQVGGDTPEQLRIDSLNRKLEGKQAHIASQDIHIASLRNAIATQHGVITALQEQVGGHKRDQALTTAYRVGAYASRDRERVKAERKQRKKARKLAEREPALLVGDQEVAQ